MTKIEKLDDSDVATILAALRLFQQEYRDMDAVSIAEAWPFHFEVNVPDGCQDGDDLSDVELDVTPEPLGSDDIDDLCERINCASLLKVSRG